MILSVVLISTIGAMAASRETQRRASFIAVGRSIAQSKIEQMRSANFAKYPEMTGVSTDPSLPSGNSIQVSASEYPNVGQNQIYHVQVTITWPEGAGVRTVNYETLVAQR